MHDAIVTAVAANANPSRRSLTSQTAARMARIASSSSGRRKNVPVVETCVQTAKPTTAAAVNGATRRASRPDRSCSSPVVRRDKKVAPCSRQISTRVTPVYTA